jgi:hypothetical protein
MTPGAKQWSNLEIALKQAELTHIDSRISLFSTLVTKTTSFLTIDTSKEIKANPWETPNTMLAIFFHLSDEKQLYYRKVYSFFELMEDFGGIVGSFQMIFTPLATYSSILMTNYLLNNHFVHENKSPEKGLSEMLSRMES